MNLEKSITNYRRPQEATDLIRSTKIALLVGISGAGKDTIKKALLERPGFADIISHTTRQPRMNAGVMEVEGRDYHFVTSETAQHMLDKGEFVEAKYVHGTVYGTSLAEVRRASKVGVAITDIDVQGVAEYRAVSNDVIAIFIVPPTYDTWLERLRRRYATDEEFEAEWPKRRNSAIKELKAALLVPYYHFVVNDSFDEALAAIIEIISHESDEFHSKDDDARIRARQLLADIQDRI